MQVYGLRFNYFCRYGEKNNSVVFDILPEDRALLDKGKITIDEIYDKMIANPVEYVKRVKENGLTRLIGIAGIIGDNYDLSNGVGKSTILEGICYAHYEQIVRKNVNTDKVSTAGLAVVPKMNGKYPPKMKESWVEEIFEEAGKIYRIKRGRTFTSTQQNSSPLLEFVCYNEGEEDSQAGHRKADTNESIAKVTPMDYDLFVNSVLFGQSDAGKFLTGTDKTRKEMLVGLLRLEDVINGCLENIRKRKNAKDKDITILNTQIDVVDGSLKSKEPIDVIEAKIKLLQEDIKLADIDIKKANTKIEELSRSEVVKVIENIKTEGKKVQDDLTAQKEVKESQIKEWNNLSKETETKIALEGTKIKNLTEKRKGVQDQISKLETETKQFDLAFREEILKKVEKAREWKPKLIKSVNDLQADKEKLVADIASEKSENSRLTKETSSLEVQLQNVQGDEFVCDKCKSKVSRKHVLEEIRKNRELSKEHTVKISEFEATQKGVVEKLTKIQSNLDKANEFLIKENEVKSEIKDNDNKKQKLEETKKLQSEDYGKMLDDMKAEMARLNRQKAEYVQKSNDISNKYDVDINKLQNKLNELSVKFKSAKKDAEDIENVINSLRKENEVNVNKKSQFDSQIGSLKKDIENIQRETEKLKQLREKCTQETALLNRLVLLEDIYGLEGIQTRIIKKYLPLLNNYIKEVIDVLSNGDINIKVYVNDKSKIDIAIEGNLADNFTMTSGGEKMLERLAIDIGLAMLSFTRCASKPELIALDEVFDPLDGYHTQAVFRLIHKLQDKFNRVIVISHKEDINKFIKNQILIEKGTGLFGQSKVRRIT